MLEEVNCINCIKYGTYEPICGKCTNYSEFTLTQSSTNSESDTTSMKKKII